MDFKRSFRSRKIKLESGRNLTDYPHVLQLYNDPPQSDFSLELPQVEEYAIERLKVLKAIETVGVRHVKTSTNYKEAMLKELKNVCGKEKNLPIVMKRSSDTNTVRNDEDYLERQKDHISHLILRLAYCKSEELRKWFVTQEMDLFRFRFCQETREGVEQFLEINNLNISYKPISESEKKEVWENLINGTFNNYPIDQTDYYKVPFTEALSLVRKRHVYVSQGYAYVPHQDLVVIVENHFRTTLSRALAITARMIPNLNEDERLLPMLKGLSQYYVGNDYMQNKKIDASAFTAEMINQLSAQSFPPCMQQLHGALRRDNHLKHGGRMQYGLFLKGIGLPLQEALKFWRTAFSKTMDPDKFDKQYAYNVRHSYGQEGKRTNYTPYSCMKIITANAPTQGDHHGCPFRHTDTDLLKQTMNNNRALNQQGVDEVMDYVKKGHYQIACGRYFDLMHDTPNNETVINHPNQYFDESHRIKTGGAEAKAVSTPKTSGGVIRVSASQSSSQSSSQSGTQSHTQPTSSDTAMTGDDLDDDDDDDALLLQAAESCDEASQ